ncbi:unnamed protein product [Gemmata massiliana]|uniref:Secreted protein n=1 Tax=Gemmata massiliana TaxID=1210884 RepID=A0A6P2DHI4_9BACT|nr:hypothetical protein [Gemmata massiliana]VTS01893.1 unnamed protein product [Gemmata massiliana]
MLRLGAIFRTFMLIVCLVPFTSAQQAAGALAPILPVVPVGGLPVTPVNEEDDEREVDGKERVSSPSRHYSPVREPVERFTPGHTPYRSHLTRVRAVPPVSEDPFRNGLGTPYRC